MAACGVTVSTEHVVFVPGIMGSSLRFVGVGPLGNRIDESVWDENLEVLWDTLARRPERLIGELVPGALIREMRLLGTPIERVCGPILALLEELGYAESQGSLTAFTYDWRQDIALSGVRLADRLEQVDGKTSIVSYSMGCLVTRFALAERPSLRGKINRCIEIGGPILGSALAFEALRGGRLLSKALDAGLKAKHRIYPELKARLHSCLLGFESLFQLLPPASEKTLLTSSGEGVAAGDARVWPPMFHRVLEQASSRHRIFSTCSPPLSDVFYGADVDTTHQYLVDDGFQIVRAIETGTMGDGTVSIASAIHDSAEDVRRPVLGIPPMMHCRQMRMC
jgi:hypothetical protein